MKYDPHFLPMGKNCVHVGKTLLGHGQGATYPPLVNHWGIARERRAWSWHLGEEQLEEAAKRA